MRLNKITLKGRHIIREITAEVGTITVPGPIEGSPSKSEKNVWYRNPQTEKSLIYYRGEYNFGFSNAGKWTNSYRMDPYSLSRCTIATYKDVKEMLIQECKKRFTENEKFRCLEDSRPFTFHENNGFNYSLEGDYLYLGFGKIYAKGKWASSY